MSGEHKVAKEDRVLFSPRKGSVGASQPPQRAAEAVLEERKLRFELFPTKRRESNGGITATLLDVHPKDLETKFKTAKVLRRGVFDEFTQKAYPVHTQMRLLWSAVPFKQLRETTIDVCESYHLLPASWRVVAQGLPETLPHVMLCDDEEGQQKRGMGDAVSTHLLLRPVSSDVIKMPAEDGAFYLLREPRELAEHHVMVRSASLPVSVCVRISRSMLARAAWQRLALTCARMVPKVPRVLRLDTCRDLDVYGCEDRHDPVLKWSACRIGSCAPAALAKLGAHLDHWLARKTNGHVYAKKLQIYAHELQLEHAPRLAVLLHVLIWVVLTQHRMRDFPVEISGASQAVQQALTTPASDVKSALKDVPESVRVVFTQLSLRDTVLLPTMKLSYM